MSGAYESLFRPAVKSGQRWLDGIPQEAREWCEGLADAIIERGEEPTVWNWVNHSFAEKFGEWLPKSKTTIPDTIRRLVQERG